MYHVCLVPSGHKRLSSPETGVRGGAAPWVLRTVLCKNNKHLELLSSLCSFFCIKSSKYTVSYSVTELAYSFSPETFYLYLDVIKQLKKN